MSDQLMLDVDQAGELKAAFRREKGCHGESWDNGLIKVLCQKGILGQVLDMLHGGRIEIKPMEKSTESVSNLASLLEIVGRVSVPATTSRFIVCEKFVPDTGHTTKVKICRLGHNFLEWFFWREGKNEDPMAKQTLRCYKLRQASLDAPIIVALGGEDKAETTLSELFFLLKKQKSGKSGVLLTNGYSNIFYVRDQSDRLRAVYVCWDDNGWSVDAFSPGPLDHWCGGCRVFSRHSLFVSL